MYNPTNNEISLKVYNMHLYHDHTLYSFPLCTFLWPEDDPQWPKHVAVSTINRIHDSCVLTYPQPPPLIARSVTDTNTNATFYTIPEHLPSFCSIFITLFVNTSFYHCINLATSTWRQPPCLISYKNTTFASSAVICKQHTNYVAFYDAQLYSIT